MLEPLPECTGTLFRLFTDRGYGFIREDVSRRDIFLHMRETPGGMWERLKVGDRLRFRAAPDGIQHGERRYKAIDVSLIEDGQ